MGGMFGVEWFKVRDFFDEGQGISQGRAACPYGAPAREAAFFLAQRKKGEDTEGTKLDVDGRYARGAASLRFFEPP